MGAIKVTDKLVDSYIEDTFLPDLILEIITKNRVYENLDLYSVENRLLYSLRASLVEEVVRKEVRATMRLAQSQIVNEYLNKRHLQRVMEERDPLSLTQSDILVKVMRDLTREVMRDALRYRTFESMIEANFLKLLGQDFVPKFLREIA
jgi:hypothetical protein